MHSRLLLVCFLVSCVTVTYIKCGRNMVWRQKPGHLLHPKWGTALRASSRYHHRTHCFGHNYVYPPQNKFTSVRNNNQKFAHYPVNPTGWSNSLHTYPSNPGVLSGANWSKTQSPRRYPSRPVLFSGTDSNNGHLSLSESFRNSHPLPSYVAPQYVYVQEFKQSDSRYRDLLAGLSLYNLGRLHSHHHSHYYFDDAYRRRYVLSGSSATYSKPTDEARCLLRVKENGNIQALKIPCEIVSTFTEGSKKLAVTPETQVNKTVCTTSNTIINNTMPVNDSSTSSTVTTNTTMVISSMCTTNSTALDPLTVKGSPLNTNKMECVVEIHTKEALFRNNIDCGTLMTYAKMPETKEDNGGKAS